MNDNNNFIEDDFLDEDTMILEMEDGSEIRCLVLAVFELDESSKLAGKSYIALNIVDSEDILLYIYEEGNDGSFVLHAIEDDYEFEMVGKRFDELVNEEYSN